MSVIQIQPNHDTVQRIAKKLAGDGYSETRFVGEFGVPTWVFFLSEAQRMVELLGDQLK